MILQVEDILFNVPVVIISTAFESESVERLFSGEGHGKIVSDGRAVHVDNRGVFVCGK